MTIFTNNGSASNPAVTNTNDNNTGIFYPVWDTVALSTNGVERIRVSDIGVTTPIGGGGFNNLQIVNLSKLTGNTPTTIILTMGLYSFAKIEAYQAITTGGSNQYYTGFFGMRDSPPNTLWINQNGATATWGDLIGGARTLTFNIPHISGSGNTSKWFTIFGSGIDGWSIT